MFNDVFLSFALSLRVSVKIVHKLLFWFSYLFFCFTALEIVSRPVQMRNIKEVVGEVHKRVSLD